MAFADYDKIVLFGDSITEQSYDQTRGFGFGAALADDERLKFSIEDLDKFPTTFLTIEDQTIFFGANDAALPDKPQHVPLDRYLNNLREIINHPALKPHNPRIILITPPPICEYRTQESDVQKGKIGISRLAANTRRYAEAALSVGSELGIPTINLWEAFMEYTGGWHEGEPLPGSKELPKNGKLGELLQDGLHFGPQGLVAPEPLVTLVGPQVQSPANCHFPCSSRILYDLLMKTIKENYPELDPENLELVFPRWEDAPKEAL